MESRTILLALHIAAVASWLGADLLRYVLTPRLTREGGDIAAAWARQVVWLHARYYAPVVVAVLVTGVLLVLDGDWAWESDFLWAGFGAVLGGALLGARALRPLARRRADALEAGAGAEADAAGRRYLQLSLVTTALPLLALVAMVEKW